MGPHLAAADIKHHGPELGWYRGVGLLADQCRDGTSGSPGDCTWASVDADRRISRVSRAAIRTLRVEKNPGRAPCGPPVASVHPWLETAMSCSAQAGHSSVREPTEDAQ